MTTLTDIIKKSEEDFDKKFNSAKVVRTGGLFNGETPIIFKEEDDAIEKVKVMIYPYFKDFLAQSIRQAVEEAVSDIRPERDNDDSVWASGYNSCIDEIEQRITNLLQ